jgi:hypothetical protein
MRHQVANQVPEVLKAHVITEAFRHEGFLGNTYLGDVGFANGLEGATFQFQGDRLVIFFREYALEDDVIMGNHRADEVGCTNDTVGVQHVDQDVVDYGPVGWRWNCLLIQSGYQTF